MEQASHPSSALVPLALAWIGYFALHSLLAGLWAKRAVASRWPTAMPYYRLLFNSVALLGLAVPLWLMWQARGPWLWEWTGGWAWVAHGAAVTVVLGTAWSLRYYDGAEFLGTRQAREGRRDVHDQERFHISPLHRHVRHPWYALGLLLVWTRDMDAARLLSAALATAYLLVGLRLEEHKLVTYHGEAYRRYRDRVPALVPRPWRRLTGEEADALVRSAAGDGPDGREARP